VNSSTALASRPSQSVAALLDALAIVVFVLIGRGTHGEPVLSGAAGTAWPFLVGAAVGWLVLLASRRWPATSWRGGAVVVAATVIVGMGLRLVAGDEVDLTFVAVATAFLGLFLLGWRALVMRRRG
jgi:hypothetical protein